MIKLFIKIALLALVGLGAFLTNPDKNKHQQVFVERAKAYIDQQAQPQEDSQEAKAFSKLFKGFKTSLTKASIKPFAELMVASESYGVCSLTTIGKGENKRFIGVGAFGYVFIPDLVFDEISKELKKAL